MRRIKPDIVHTHTAKAGALGRIAAIINRVPVKIHTFHGHVFHSYFGRFKTNLFIMIERMLAAFTDRIIVISQNQLIDVRDRYRIASKDKYSVIPVGLNLEPFLNSKRNGNLKKQFSVDEDTLLVGIVGRLVDVKNHKMFLDVAKDIKIEAHDVKARFLIIGDGPLRTELESYAQMLKIRDSVIFMGWQKEMAAIYKDLDIVCLTSLNEGTPISLIEAMASGKAVLSTDVGGVRDVVTHNITGLLSPSGDVGKFSSNLLVLLRDKARREEIAGRARESVLKNFSRERLIRDVERLYAEELRKRSA